MYSVMEVDWDTADVVAETLGLDTIKTRNVVQLFTEDNTIPFIARYRKERTGNMDVDKLRAVQHLIAELKAVMARVTLVSKTINKLGRMTPTLASALKQARSVTEVDQLYQPYKPGNMKTLADRARGLGLDPLAYNILHSPDQVDVGAYIQPSTKGLETTGAVELGCQHILADIISKEKTMIDKVRQHYKCSHVTLDCSKITHQRKKKEESKTKSAEKDTSYKYEQYFNFSMNIKVVKPHQILAINRGESKKVLSVKVVFPDEVRDEFCRSCTRYFTPRANITFCKTLIEKSVVDAYTRLVFPLLCREIRSDLTKMAERASIDVFASNLKSLLLLNPVRGKCILGLDPGFRNGCKMAVISSTGLCLYTDVLYMLSSKADEFASKKKLKELVLKFRCDTFAIGNGTACRETEKFVSDMIQSKQFSPLNVSYCIVDECGASIYSVSDEARKEMPDMDPCLRGAGRRLQDPLAELVKIEPKHLGVGMYQHDMPEKQLKCSLESVVEECVSFVGVDINTCSECLLRKIAGLNATRAKNIIEWRNTKGSFTNREQLKRVKGLGLKSYEQCAGFVRIPRTSRDSSHQSTVNNENGEKTSCGVKRKAGSNDRKSKKQKVSDDCVLPNPLDRTWIHPESYEAALRFIDETKLGTENIGDAGFIKGVQHFMCNRTLEHIAIELAVDLPTMKLIVDGLLQPSTYDLREDFQTPIFRQGVASLSDLKCGTDVTGRVTNVTHFGAFTDIGVGVNALIHVSKMRPHLMRGRKQLEIGDKVNATVESIDIDKKRIGLILNQLL